MNDRFRMSDLATLLDSRSATFSQALVDGLTLSGWPVGTTDDPRGLEAVLANLSVTQAKALGLLTSGTSGPRGFISSRSAVLQSSLVSRLQAKLASAGSTLYALTWKSRTTPSGLSIFAQRASARRTSGSDCTGWPTAAAAARDWKSSASNQHGKNARPLNEVARLAGWATPAAQEAGGTPEQFLARKEALNGKCGVSLTSLNLQAQLAGWNTPAVTNADRGGQAQRMETGRSNLQDQVMLTGATLSGSTAETASIGQLNPALPRWLQGFPSAWIECAPSKLRGWKR